jgi:RHS repeat-associated protein
LDNWTAVNTNSSLTIPIIGSANESIGNGNPYGSLWVSNNNISVTPLIEGTNFFLAELTVGLGTQIIVAAICDLAGNTTYATSTIFSTFVTNANYGYCDAGCVTSIIYKGTDYFNSQELKWDGQYQLTEFKANGNSLERTGYDSLNRRAWTCRDGITNFYVYDGEHVIAEVGGDGSLLKTYVSGPGVDNWLAMTVHTGSTALTYIYLTDHLGTVHALADANGTIVESYMYDAWGRILGVYDGTGNPLTESAVGNNILWQGREYSWKTGLYYFRARWYDPITGRWVSNDPIGISGGLNQYVFCGNNPVNFTDPFGLTSEWAFWDPNSAVGRQFVSIGDAFGSTLARPFYPEAARNVWNEAVNNSGQAIMDESCAGKGARTAYWGAIGVSAAATAVAGWEISGLHVFAKGGQSWHLGLETSGNMNIVHVGNHVKHGIHIAFGAVRPYAANLHIYLQRAAPFFRIWKP